MYVLWFSRSTRARSSGSVELKSNRGQMSKHERPRRHPKSVGMWTLSPTHRNPPSVSSLENRKCVVYSEGASVSSSVTFQECDDRGHFSWVELHGRHVSPVFLQFFSRTFSFDGLVNIWLSFLLGSASNLISGGTVTALKVVVVFTARELWHGRKDWSHFQLPQDSMATLKPLLNIGGCR